MVVRTFPQGLGLDAVCLRTDHDEVTTWVEDTINIKVITSTITMHTALNNHIETTLVLEEV